MNDREAYERDGYIHLRQFLPVEVAMGVIARLKSDLARQGINITDLQQENMLLKRPASELYGHHYAPLAFLCWGMTPAIAALTGKSLLPTYAYFRVYREGDICRFHGDRQSCEHSLSLTLAYSDDIAWPLEVATARTDRPYPRNDECYTETDQIGAVAMAAGDAVLYQGVHHHHGRCTPNPNRWSAHLFLHWIDRNGPYASFAFDGHRPPTEVTL